MKKRELLNLGFPPGAPANQALQAGIALLKAGRTREDVRDRLAQVLAQPAAYATDPVLAPVAQTLLAEASRPATGFAPRPAPAPYRQWGQNLDANAVEQLERACQLPVAVQGALMPDAHVGYGLPIGGVLAVDRAVIPNAVGVDIACRMKLTVLDLPVAALRERQQRLVAAIEAETRFGVGAEFRQPRHHRVMDEDWGFSPVIRQHKDKAWHQLGTSGSGNHFVEFGVLTVTNPDAGLAAGAYLALLSHSGSRGTGADVAAHYHAVAQERCRHLPRELANLAWLDLDSDEGREYWAAMELMGRYAAANHELIHRAIAEHLGTQVRLDLENHHNFAWLETHFGRPVVVHRKGATPAGPGVVGIIPGSMASPGYVVRGRGQPDSMCSASHGAGRVMSRKAALHTFTWHDAKRLLRERDVTLISAGLDEVPMVYKNIDDVMAAQADLVEVLARFEPKLVKMAPGGERAED